MNSRILIRVDCDGGVGFGHFSRCLSLARTLRERLPSAKISFWGSLNEFANAALARYQMARLEVPCGGFGADDVSVAQGVSCEYDALILDTYCADQTFVDGLKSRPCKLVVLDDMRSLDLRDTDLVVSFRAGAESIPYGARKEALGLGYLVVKPELQELRLSNLSAAIRPIHKVLVFFSGADAESPSLGNAVAAAAAALPDAVISYIAKNGHSLQGLGQAKVIAPRAEVEELYTEADLIVTGGGLVKYESAYCGIPNASLSQTALQDEDTKILAARNLTLDLGRAERFDASAIARSLARFVGDTTALGAQRRAFREALSTDSTERLANLVLAL